MSLPGFSKLGQGLEGSGEEGMLIAASVHRDQQ